MPTIPTLGGPRWDQQGVTQGQWLIRHPGLGQYYLLEPPGGEAVWWRWSMVSGNVKVKVEPIPT